MTKLLAHGAYVDEGHLRKDPILCIGPVLERGKGLPSGKNLADYIDKKGYFNLVKYAQDHSQKAMKGSAAPPFVGTGNVILGQLSPHITTEVDCESLFSQAGHAAQPNRNRTTAETFERQVIAKHRLARIYCDPVAVCVCNLASGETRILPTKDLSRSRAVLPRHLGACALEIRDY